DAFYWFEKSAQQGYTAAQIKLGFLLMNGLGCAEDRVSAYSSILAASKAGDHRGDGYLEALKSQLDQQQLAQVKTKLESRAPAANSTFQPVIAVTSFVP